MVTSWTDCRSALAERVRELVLDGLASEQVYEHLASIPTNVSLPCVELTQAGLQEKYRWFSTDHLLWEYPVGVLLLFRGDPKDPAREAPYLTWRAGIATAIPGWKPTLDGLLRVRIELDANVTSGFRGRSEPGQVRDPLGPAWLKVAGGLVVTFEVVQPRAQ